MSTRSSTWFVDAGGAFRPVEAQPLEGYAVAARVYRHSDGYPSGHGRDLHAFLDAVADQTADTRYSDPSYLAAKLVVYLAREFAETYAPDSSGQYVRTSHADTRPLDFLSVGVLQRDPGDIEYVYVVDCGTRAARPRITCYEIAYPDGWDAPAALGVERAIPGPWSVAYLQAAEPDALPAAEGILVEIVEDADEMGLPRVDVSGPSREAVLDYIRAHWGDEDADWFDEYVAGRISGPREV
jgi:hypothetical protein